MITWGNMWYLLLIDGELSGTQHILIDIHFEGEIIGVKLLPFVKSLKEYDESISQY
jgi:hypothetical protein